MPEPSAQPVLTDMLGTLGVIRLNRPAVLNSLTLEMVQLIEAALDEFEADDDIRAVLLEGAGERGLCAGGDIRAVQRSVAADDGEWVAFLEAEYRLNLRIAHLAKPYVALMDGIVMGGGVGLSAHGRYRIATDKLHLAMPEVGIGFFPDVGASWLLSRPGSELGTYLALTGQTFGAGVAIAAGLADLCIGHQDMQHLIAEVAMLPPGSGGDAVGEVVARTSQAPQESLDAQWLAMIDRCFGGSSITEITDALAGERSRQAIEIRAWLARQCPTSLKVTLKLLRAGRTMPNLKACLEMELAAARHVLRRPDFSEGVRVALLDKDHMPRWQPWRLEDVDDAEVESWLEPAEGGPEYERGLSNNRNRACGPRRVDPPQSPDSAQRNQPRYDDRGPHHRRSLRG